MDGREHVLVVDDYDDAREMYAEFLELAGYRVSQAKNGVEALKKADGLVPDVILMDLSLPDMDGIEVMRSIPVVVVTGHSPENLEADSLQCDGFVTKPCPPDALVAEVARLLTSRDSSGRGGRKR